MSAKQMLSVLLASLPVPESLCLSVSKTSLLQKLQRVRPGNPNPLILQVGPLRLHGPRAPPSLGLGMAVAGARYRVRRKWVDRREWEGRVDRFQDPPQTPTPLHPTQPQPGLAADEVLLLV